MSQAQQEVDSNYEIFSKMLPSILPLHRDKHALMKGGQVLGYFSTAEDARIAAAQFIPDGIYSIQQVTDSTLNYGFFTHAIVVN